MRKIFCSLFLFIAVAVSAQEEVVHSVYFETAKFNLEEAKADEVLNFVKAIDTTRIESIQIFGYTDDRGKDDYNYKLSVNRANTVRSMLIAKGIKNKIIVTIEGRGRILIEDDIDNVSEVRSKNRRVDVVANFRPLPPAKLNIPGLYTNLRKDMVVGDRIFLENVYFEKGSSQLEPKSKKALDQIVKQLQKYKNFSFEIQGHICCTPSFQKEAIDKETKKRELSINRAKSVFKYLRLKRVDPKRMSTKGYGNTKPLKLGPEYDRRVELVITKKT